MPCIERSPTHAGCRSLFALTLVAAALAGCGNKAPPAPAPAAAPAPPAAPAAPATGVSPANPAVSPGPTSSSTAGGAALAPNRGAAATTWAAYKRQAAQRLVQATPQGSYTGPVPEPLLAIPVLEIEVNADGSVRRIDVLRRPRQAQDTVQLAIDAVRRAAPFGDASRLPRPWRFTEAFLFDEQRRFKPRTLDE